jgi:hypothetical protein
MRFHHPGWVVLVWLLAIANVVSIWFAAAAAETWHATSHGFLAVVCAIGAQWLAARRLRT